MLYAMLLSAERCVKIRDGTVCSGLEMHTMHANTLGIRTTPITKNYRAECTWQKMGGDKGKVLYASACSFYILLDTIYVRAICPTISNTVQVNTHQHFQLLQL